MRVGGDDGADGADRSGMAGGVNEDALLEEMMDGDP